MQDRSSPDSNPQDPDKNTSKQNQYTSHFNFPEWTREVHSKESLTDRIKSLIDNFSRKQ